MRSDWIEAVGKISTHPPVKGGTSFFPEWDVRPSDISTHLPVKGGTEHQLRKAVVERLQPTRP